MQTLEEKQQLLAEAGRPHCRGFIILQNDNFTFIAIHNTVTNTISQLKAGMESAKVDIFTEEQAEAIWQSFQEADNFHLKDRYLEGFYCFMVTQCPDNISLHFKNDEGRLKTIVLRDSPKGRKAEYVCNYACNNTCPK
jgi:hypothetical protein